MEKSVVASIGSVAAAEGKREELISVMEEESREMPGCLACIISRDAGDTDEVRVAEAWDRKESHDASLVILRTMAAMEKGRPVITGFGQRIELGPAILNGRQTESGRG